MEQRVEQSAAKVPQVSGVPLVLVDTPEDASTSADMVADALLEHARWIGSDLAQRIDTLTQRAGILLAASLTLMTLWNAILLATSINHPVVTMIGCGSAILAYTLPVTYSICALRTRKYHSVGATSITRYLGSDGRPAPGLWPDIYNKLLNDLSSPSDKGEASVLQGMENDINDRADNLRMALITVVIATATPPVVAVITYLVRSAM